MLKLQFELEKKYNKNQQIPKLTKEFEESGLIQKPEEDEDMRGYNLCIRLLVHMAIQKRIMLSAAIGMLSDDLEESVAVIEDMVAQGMVKYEKGYLIVVFEVDAETQKEMDMYMYPPPLVIEPEEIKNNRDTGYYTIKGSVMQKKSHTNDDVCIDVLNILNSFRYRIDKEVLNDSSQYKSLSKRKEGESDEDYKKRFKQWQKFDQSTRHLIEEQFMDIPFWLTHGYDKRGRIYCRGYHLNYQSDEWRKAIVQFPLENVE